MKKIRDFLYPSEALVKNYPEFSIILILIWLFQKLFIFKLISLYNGIQQQAYSILIIITKKTKNLDTFNLYN